MSFTKFDIDMNLNFFICFILYTTNIISLCFFFDGYYIFLVFVPSIILDFIYYLTTTVCTLKEAIFIYSSITTFLFLNFYFLTYNLIVSYLLHNYILAYLEIIRFGLKLLMLEHYNFKLKN